MILAPVISFPGLGIDELNPPQKLPFTILGKEIYLYGIIIAVGFLIAFYYAAKRAKEFGSNFDLLTDAVVFAVPLAIICARAYYVVSRWEEVYASNPISALYIWEGGIAIYGGVIGAALGLILFSKIKKQKLTPYLDIMGLGLLIGQLIGRWGNFFNREAYGAEIFDNFFLRMGLSEGGLTRYWHPTFLYESVWNLVGFVLLHFGSKKRKYDGQVFLWYVAWYGLGRAWIEGLRTDSLYLGSTDIRTSQLLAVVSCVLSVALLLYIRFVKKPDGSTMLVNAGAAGAAAESVCGDAEAFEEAGETDSVEEDTPEPVEEEIPKTDEAEAIPESEEEETSSPERDEIPEQQTKQSADGELE